MAMNDVEQSKKILKECGVKPVKEKKFRKVGLQFPHAYGGGQ
jgi:hypothetical protein